MASSRWKRFAFFDRHALNIPNEVLEDVIPRRSISSSSNSNNNNNPQQRSNAATEEDVCFVVTTAGLPLATRQTTTTTATVADGKNQQQQPQPVDKDEAVGAMWSSLLTCSAITFENAIVGEEISASIAFPTRGNNINSTTSMNNKNSSSSTTTAMDGLVLAFLSSAETDFVHCVDITVRCNPPLTTNTTTTTANSTTTTATATTTTASTSVAPPTNATSSERDLEDMDGWRGFLAPFAANNNPTFQEGRTAEDEGIRDLAVCRLRGQGESHSAVHLACLARNRLVIWEDPHLYLSCRRPLQLSSQFPADAKLWHFQPSWAAPAGSSSNTTTANVDGDFCAVSLIPGVVALGTVKGAVLVYVYNPWEPAPMRLPSTKTFRRYLRIPPPLSDSVKVTSVKVAESRSDNKLSVFVVYNRQSKEGEAPAASSSSAGICCYDMPVPSYTAGTLSILAPSARHDLDGRFVAGRRLVDAAFLGHNDQNARITVARPDGLYTYSHTERTSVAPIDGNKLTVAIVPHVSSQSSHTSTAPPFSAAPNSNVGHHLRRSLDSFDEPIATLGYALLASTDEKSGRDAVDVYDSTNKLVAFHLLLSPGHRAIRAAGVATPSTTCSDGSTKGGRSSALVFTSGGSLVTLTEKRTSEKVDLLVKKNLYSAAVVVAYSDPNFPASEIAVLYRRYAEHLYRKGDLAGAVDQYIHTIGSLESSHVIFRFLDAPKIPLLVKYLNQLRERGRATPVHDELLRTCYLKLNDAEAAEAIASSANTVSRASSASVLSNLTANPTEALSTICALEAPEAVDILIVHGASLARVMPQETAGIVVALCVGTFSPKSLAQSSSGDAKDLKQMLELHSSSGKQEKAHDPYPVELFAASFIEQPKMLRLILAHCNRNRCHLTPALRRTLLELTLQEWNQAKRTGDTEMLKLRNKEAIAALTDSHSREIGDYDALVICQLAGFEEGQLLLYERLQMTPMLLERYAKDGSEKARRQMLAMCQTDPEILADVLGYFVAMASERLADADSKIDDDGSYANDTEELLDDIQATLALARRRGASPPVRIVRILAGEGTGQFSVKPPATSNSATANTHTVPLSVALDYVGAILEESRHEGARLKAEVEEYNELCNAMEREIESLLRTSRGLGPLTETQESRQQQIVNIDELYTKIRQEGDGSGNMPKGSVDNSFTREAFWREMNQSDGTDSLETIARFFAKGVIR